MPTAREARASNLSARRFTEISAAAKVLVATMHTIQYGRFEDFHVHNGDPVFDPPPRLIKVKRIGSAEEPTSHASDDWLLKGPIVDLLREFAALGNGIVQRLEFRRGLPCLVEYSLNASGNSHSCEVRCP